MDHLVPVSRGGSVYSRENLRAAHRICNTRRGNRPLDAARRSPDGGGISAARPGGPLPTSREW
jgi:5-methylcytosine-specific restriction endonuclease McrA